MSGCNSNTVRRQCWYPSFGVYHSRGKFIILCACEHLPIHILEGPHCQEQPWTTTVTLRFQGPPYELSGQTLELLWKNIFYWKFTLNSKLQQYDCALDETLHGLQSFPEEPSQVFSLAPTLWFASDHHFSTHPTFIPPQWSAKSANFLLDNFTEFTLPPLWNLSLLKRCIRNCQTISARAHDLSLLEFSRLCDKIFCKPSNLAIWVD